MNNVTTTAPAPATAAWAPAAGLGGELWHVSHPAAELAAVARGTNGNWIGVVIPRGGELVTGPGEAGCPSRHAAQRWAERALA